MPNDDRTRTTVRQVLPREDPVDVLARAIAHLTWDPRSFDDRRLVEVSARFAPVASVTTPEGETLWAVDPSSADEMVGAWAVTVTYAEDTDAG